MLDKRLFRLLTVSLLPDLAARGPSTGSTANLDMSTIFASGGADRFRVLTSPTTGGSMVQSGNRQPFTGSRFLGRNPNLPLF